jgi:hypothetical protein
MSATQTPVPPAREPDAFIMQRKIARLSDEVLTDSLRRFAALNSGRAFTMQQFKAWRERPCHPQALVNRFGTWRDVLRRAGVQNPRPSEWSAHELLEHLQRVWKALGRRPVARDLRPHGAPCPGAYDRRWGTVMRACDALARYHRGETTWEDALNPRPPARTRRGLSKRLRWRVLTRDGHRCVACGACPYEDRAVKLHIDHIVPVCRGGADEESNLRVLCSNCNLGRATGAAEQAA